MGVSVKSRKKGLPSLRRRGGINEGDTGEAIVGHTHCTSRYERNSTAFYGNMSLGFLFWALIRNTGTDYNREKKMAEAISRIF